MGGYKILSKAKYCASYEASESQLQGGPQLDQEHFFLRSLVKDHYLSQIDW